jgi:hypothetical protein
MVEISSLVPQCFLLHPATLKTKGMAHTHTFLSYLLLEQVNEHRFALKALQIWLGNVDLLVDTS